MLLKTCVSCSLEPINSWGLNIIKHYWNIQRICNANINGWNVSQQIYIYIYILLDGKLGIGHQNLFKNELGYCAWSNWFFHQLHMMMSSKETFSALLALCAVPGDFPLPVTRSFDVFFDLRPNKRLSNQWWGWWFETLSSPLWRHCNDITFISQFPG